MSEGIRQESLIHSRRRLLDPEPIGNRNEPSRRGESMSGVRISREDNACSHWNIANIGSESLDHSNSLTT
jgi:hypothetical protein